MANVPHEPWMFDIDIAALITIGVIAATFFWRMLARIERKLDFVSETMVDKGHCEKCYDRREKQFRNHYHPPEDGVAVAMGGLHEAK